MKDVKEYIASDTEESKTLDMTLKGRKICSCGKQTVEYHGEQKYSI